MPERTCVRDDVTECDCEACCSAEDRFWSEQGLDEPSDHDFEDEEPTVRLPNIPMREIMGVG